MSTKTAKSENETLNRISPILTKLRNGIFLGLASSAFFLLSPSVQAQAHCQRWDVSGQWGFKQSNQAALNQLDLRQKNQVLTGTASYASGKGSVKGSIQGFLWPSYSGSPPTPAEIKMTIYWENGWVGVYEGKISPEGRIEGTGYERRSPQTKVSWFSNRLMRCSEREKPPPPPPPTARPPTAPPQKPIKTMPAPTGVPRITASPTIVTIPAGQTAGTTTLTWDSGSDHPYAEVWVKADGQDETFLVEQGKGTRSVTVELGKNYQFILTDAGQQLAKVVVTSKR